MSPADLLREWLECRLTPAAIAWLNDALARMQGGGSDRELYRDISLAARRCGKALLALDPDALARAESVRAGWNPSGWTVDQAARLALLLAAGDAGERLTKRLDQLCATADLDELVAFYRGLPLYPEPERHRARAAEGLRSNMKSVFEAVAHRNPYSAEQLSDDAWNQMVLKAVFVGSPLHAIIGLDRRANPALARMLSDYAHERWAAKRQVNPEIWRCVGPFADRENLLDDLARVLAEGGPAEQAGAILALRAAPGEAAAALLVHHGHLNERVAARGVRWDTLDIFTEA